MATHPTVEALTQRLAQRFVGPSTARLDDVQGQVRASAESAWATPADAKARKAELATGLLAVPLIGVAIALWLAARHAARGHCRRTGGERDVPRRIVRPSGSFCSFVSGRGGPDRRIGGATSGIRGGAASGYPEQEQGQGLPALKG